MTSTRKFTSGIIALEQEWADVDKLSEMLTESPPLGDVAAYLMESYFTKLYADAHTTFGPIEAGYIDPSGLNAGFIFRDSDSGDIFQVMIQHETDSYKPAPPLTAIHDKAEALLQLENELVGLSWREMREFIRGLALTLKPYIKHREDKRPERT